MSKRKKPVTGVETYWGLPGLRANKEAVRFLYVRFFEQTQEKKGVDYDPGRGSHATIVREATMLAMDELGDAWRHDQTLVWKDGQGCDQACVSFVAKTNIDAMADAVEEQA